MEIYHVKFRGLILLLALLPFVGCSGGLAARRERNGNGGPVFEDTIGWDAEYDVVVVGFGGAGAATAITAADKGARVLILEKAPEGEAGGNSAVCMQWICCTKDKAATLEYFKALRGNYLTPSDEMLRVYIDEIANNYEWFEKMGAPKPTFFNYCEFPELKGSASFTPFTVDGVNGMSPTSFGGNGAAYKLLKQNVVKRADKIDVWYEAPATELIQDGKTKIVHGVVAKVNGKDIKVRAKNGVVLCCGGFESSPEMQQNYTQRIFWPSTGNAHYNTGDGIKMALAVGADLWHMSNVVTNIEYYDEKNKTSTFAFSGTSAGIMVGGDGTRFMDETAHLRHGKMWNHGNWANSALPDICWSVFDQSGLENTKLYWTWDKGSAQQLENGTIKKADTIEGLAAIIGVDAKALKNTIDGYNAFCAGGKDLQFGRSSKLNAIVRAPYYAIRITPAMGNTQGGPVRSIKGEVLDPKGNPIPHLYEAGEIGDIWSNCYQASCNLGGGFAFGRISGSNAAVAKTDNAQYSVMNGKPNFRPENRTAAVSAGANENIGQGQGKGGTPIVVKVTVINGKISKIEILSHSETPGISDAAFAKVPDEIIAANSADVDAVGGATLTSRGIIAAVKDAISKAK